MGRNALNSRRMSPIGTMVGCALLVLMVSATARTARADGVDLSGVAKAVSDQADAVAKAQAASQKAQTTNPPSADLQAAEQAADKDASEVAKAQDAVDKAAAAKEAAKTAKDIRDSGKAYDEATKALGKAKAQAAKSDEAAKKLAKGSKYHDAKEKEREAKRLLSAALSRLRSALRDAHRNGKAVKDEASIRGDESKGAGALGCTPLSLSAMPFVPNDSTAFASLVRDGKLDAVVTGTGETIGVVATAKLTNKTGAPLDVVIPPTVLVSVSGNTQSYAVPQPVETALKPGATATVPIVGVCTQAHRPPATADHPGSLAVANPQDPQFDDVYRPQLTCAQDVIDTAAQLQRDGQFHTPFGRDPQKELLTVVQQTIWAANPSHDGRNTTKEDLANKVYEQVGATRPEDKKKVDPGIDAIWNAVQLTGAKAKVFDVDNGGGAAASQPGVASVDSNTTPGTTERPTPAWAFPKGATDKSDKTDDKGNRTISYTDADNHQHTITSDRFGHTTEKVDGKPTRTFDVEFDRQTGGRTEIESAKQGNTTTTREREYDKNGTLVRATDTDETEGKTAEYPSTRTTKERKFDENGIKTESSETKMTYGTDENFQQVATGGTKTVTRYSGKDDKGTTTRSKYNRETGQFDEQ